MTGLVARGSCACWFRIAFAVVLLASSEARGNDQGGLIVVLDLRPIRDRETARDLIPEAMATGEQVRAALEDAHQPIVGVAKLRRLLGSDSRARTFACREELSCLRPMLRRLRGRGVQRAIFGTVRFGAETKRLELTLVDLETLTKVSLRSFAVGRRRIDQSSLSEGLELLLIPPPVPAAPEPRRETPAPAAEAPQAAPPPVDEGGDVVESIDDIPSAAAPAPAPPPPSPDRFQIGGWVRSTLEFGFFTRNFHEREPDPLRLRYDPFIMRGQLLVRARYSRGRWLEIAASGALAWALFEENPDRAGDAFNLFNGQRTRGQLDPALLELYVGFFTRRFDLRLGQMRVAWGRADSRSPNDVLNARDLRDPLLGESELRHLPTPLVRGDVDFGFGSLQLVVAPFFIPDRFDVYGSNWAVVQPDAPPALRALFGLAASGLAPTLHGLVQPLQSQISTPQLNLTTATAGLRFSWTVKRLDVSHYYHYGYDPVPMLVIDPGLALALATADLSAPRAAEQALLSGGALLPLAAVYQRRHHVGLDAVTTVGPFALRLDMAFDSTRVFYRRDLLGFSSPALEAVLSVEYQTGDSGKFLILEGLYLHIFDRPPVPLLFSARDSGSVAVAFGWIFARRFQIGLRGVVGVSPLGYALLPDLGVRISAAQIKVGGVILGGEDFSFGSYFRRNNAFYVLVKYAF